MLLELLRQTPFSSDPTESVYNRVVWRLCELWAREFEKGSPLHYSRKRQKSPDKIGKRIGWLSRSAFACLSLQQIRLFLLEFFGSDQPHFQKLPVFSQNLRRAFSARHEGDDDHAHDSEKAEPPILEG